MEVDKSFIEINEKLCHLTEMEIDTLINRYYSNENVEGLINEYKIDVIPSRLYKLFPPELSKDEICPKCNIPMYLERRSKSSSEYRRRVGYCINCGHKNSNNCNCDFCKDNKRLLLIKREEEKKRMIENKRFLIFETYFKDKYNRVRLNDLSFTQKVYISALLRLALSEDLDVIQPLENVERRLAPTNTFTLEIMKELTSNRIIVVNPESPISAFVDSPKDDEFPNVYYMYKVIYDLNLDIYDNYDIEITKLLTLKGFNEEEKDEALLLWRKIALEECLEYLYYQMDSVGFSFNAGEKTVTVINDLLEHFSVSQIYGIIYRSIANATKWYQESKVSRKQAANSVISSCQRYGERAILEKWDLSKYNRIVDCSQSALSEVFFNRIASIGDLGFHMPPASL